MKISIGNSRMDRHWNLQDISLDDFVKRLSQTKRTAETVEQFKKMTKAQQDSIKDVGGFVAGELKGGRRKKDCVISRSALTLDADYATMDLVDMLEMFYDFRCIIYSTHKHTQEKPRLRLIIPLSRDVSPDEYIAVSRKVAEDIGMEYFDDTTYEPSRLMYWASTSADGEFYFKDIDGELLNPDTILGRYEDWRNVSELPVSKRQQTIVQREIKKQADPLEKKGIVGAFCRTYSVTEAIDKFISDTYKPSAMDGRYDYVPADSSAGVVIYEDKFAYSHHATDPACGKLMNAFDVVRLHKFGELDANFGEDTDQKKLPSFKAMQEFAVNDDRVKIQLAEERMAEAQTEFDVEDDSWKTQLEYNKQGIIVNNLKNLLLILNNDKALKGIVFNQLSDGMEIKGEVPWQHPSKFWRDADDAQLTTYIELNYGNFSKRNYDTAVTKAVDDRSYHPIREFLNALPEWDNIKRVDTLLIDYLGADDNSYVRAVTRKTLCAAICRVLNPGCKFDTMLVLNGPQGVGKSTLIAKLGGEWFSDSLSLNDTKDKTAAEKLQGYWILEIGELAGLRKAEVETLRSFLSRQNDIYRASFGRRTAPHLRQCVFFGTTNAENGYLRDTTGNRRFWPVRTPGTGNKQSWNITPEEVKQIWAECLYYVKQGEKLYLPKELEETAKAEQRGAMESDEREGLVREYLEKLIPENWEDLDLYDRRNFLNGTGLNGDKPSNLRQRTTVCNMEIWCECFGKDRGSLKKQDANEIATIMAKFDDWRRLKCKKRFGDYGIVVGYERINSNTKS